MALIKALMAGNHILLAGMTSSCKRVIRRRSRACLGDSFLNILSNCNKKSFKASYY